MPQTADAQFDQTVLEMIEHSPVGAVPNTPSYQDALKRLYAAHQVFADADHKDGHVTVRSLARKSCFHANNLRAFFDGQTSAEGLESNTGIFTRYAASLPAERRAKAESLRLKVAGRPVLHRDKTHVAHDPVHTLFLVPGSGPHPGLPGNYLFGSALQLTPDATGAWAVQLHDNDDGAAVFDAPDMRAAIGKVFELVECAPFAMNELEALGFRLL